MPMHIIVGGTCFAVQNVRIKKYLKSVHICLCYHGNAAWVLYDLQRIDANVIIVSRGSTYE